MKNCMIVFEVPDTEASAAAYAKSDGVSVTFYNGIEGSCHVHLTDKTARALLVHLTAAVAQRGQR